MALKKQGAKVRRAARLGDARESEFRVLAAGMASPLAQAILRRKSVAAPAEAESLCLLQDDAGGARYCWPPARTSAERFTR